MKYLFVVAHPDDEALGAGGMIYDLIHKNHDVYVCFMCSNIEARTVTSNEKSIRQQAENSMTILGVPKGNLIYGAFYDIKMNIVPHLDLVKFIESAIITVKPNIIVTHGHEDINCDHKITSECCDEAVRYFQRNNLDVVIKKYMYMEVLSSTDWAIGVQFAPNYFYEIDNTGVDKKIEALKEYNSAVRAFPHPRCEENIRALATYRGCQSGLKYAEGFIIAFEKEK